MKEDECKDCGSALVFVGSLMSGKMICRHCEQVEKQPVNLHNPGKSNLYNVGNHIGDPAYKGFSRWDEASGKDFADMIESTNTLYQLIKAGYLKLGDK